jgi:hypothetical protein
MIGSRSLKESCGSGDGLESFAPISDCWQEKQISANMVHLSEYVKREAPTSLEFVSSECWSVRTETCTADNDKCKVNAMPALVWQFQRDEVAEDPPCYLRTVTLVNIQYNNGEDRKRVASDLSAGQ